MTARAVVLNGTLKTGPEPSNTEALTQVVLDELAAAGVEGEQVRLADHDIPPGVVSEATGRPVTYDRVTGVVVVGNEDGAHHCIAELQGALVDIG